MSTTLCRVEVILIRLFSCEVSPNSRSGDTKKNMENDSGGSLKENI